MTNKLPRIAQNSSIVDTGNGRAIKYFTRLWDELCSRIENALNGLVTGIVVGDGSGNVMGRTITAGAGITVTDGDGQAGNPTIAITNTAVTPNPYGDSTHVASFTVNARGQLSAAGNVAIAFPADAVSSVFGRTGAVVGTSADIAGTATNDNAPAGYIGETGGSVVTSGSAVSLTTGTPANIASITLSVGDWLVWAEGDFTGNAATTVDRLLVSLSDTSATLDTAVGHLASEIFAGITPFPYGTPIVPVGPLRVSLAAPATVYAIGYADFAVNSCSVYGRIFALRIR